MPVNYYSDILRLERQRRILALQRIPVQPKRELRGFRLSFDYGASWRIAVLCDNCYRTVEPPLMRRRLGIAASKNCDWCGARNTF